MFRPVPDLYKTFWIDISCISWRVVANNEKTYSSTNFIRTAQVSYFYQHLNIAENVPDVFGYTVSFYLTVLLNNGKKTLTRSAASKNDIFFK